MWVVRWTAFEWLIILTIIGKDDIKPINQDIHVQVVYLFVVLLESDNISLEYGKQPSALPLVGHTCTYIYIYMYIPYVQDCIVSVDRHVSKLL